MTYRREQGPRGRYDVVVVGAGLAGIYMLYKLRGLGFTVRVLEAADGIGGTWFWNKYPGARCDVDSIDYSYSFSDELQQEWRWTERYATQGELLEYLNHVVDKFDLRNDIQLNTRVRRASYVHQGWLIETNDAEVLQSHFLVLATGALSIPNVPPIPGLEDFRGPALHTGRWPTPSPDLAGKVGVVGSGSSGIGLVPEVAKTAEHLFVLQRSPNFTVPAQNRPIGDAEWSEITSSYPERRAVNRQSRVGYPLPEVVQAYSLQSALDVSEEERTRAYRAAWNHGGPTFARTFSDILTDPQANHTAAEFVRDRIQDIVDDRDTADRLTPTDHPIGTKRLCVDHGYYETFNRDNVELVDLTYEPIRRIVPCGIETESRNIEVDTLILATGFDAMTGSMLSMDIRGRDGRSLDAAWSEGPRTYLGLGIHGFPNMFLVAGPGSPSVLCQMFLAAEQHVEWISDLLAHMREREFGTVEADQKAEEEWVQHVNSVADATLLPLASSWWRGANIDGKAHVFMPYAGGFPAYDQRCREVSGSEYQGFDLS